MIIRGQNGTTMVNMEKGLEIRKTFTGNRDYGIWQGEICLGVYEEYLQAVTVLNEIEVQYMQFLTEQDKKKNAVYRMPKQEKLPDILEQAYVEVRDIMNQ